jgi:uncharacterized membrane protein
MTKHTTSHSHEDAAARREHDNLHRLMFFSDGVFAVAITLLALEIHVPEDWHGTIADLWQHMAPSLAPYAISFAVTGAYWSAHRRYFARIVRADGILNTLNLLLLGLVALLPPATRLMFGEQVTLNMVLVYLGLIGVTGLALAALWGYAAFIGRLTTPDLPRAYRVWTFASAIMTPLVCCLMSMALGFELPKAGIAAAVTLMALLLAISVRIGRRLEA